MKSLALTDVAVRLGRVRALRGVSIDLAGGEVLMLVGPNGAGKSTLMRVLLGLVRPDAGGLSVDGKKCKADNEFRRKLGYLPENVAFSENLTGRDVLRFFAQARGVDRKAVERVLKRVGLAAAARRTVRGYSRGMRQRLGLAAAILSEPELLILDEPTGGLDQEGLATLWSVLEEWRQKGRLVVLSAHDLALLERRVDRMCVLRDGAMLACDRPDALRRSAGLPHVVHMQLAGDSANGAVDALVEATRSMAGASVVIDDGWLRVEMAPDSLLPLMDIRGRFPSAVIAMRVEEPSLDVVYERFLEVA